MMNRLQPSCLLLMAAVCLAELFVPPDVAGQDALPHSSESVRRTVRDVLSDPDYRHLIEKDSQADDSEEPVLPEWLEKILEWLLRDDSSSNTQPESGFSLASVMYYLALIVLAVALVLLLAGIMRSMRQQENHAGSEMPADAEAISPTSPPGDVSSREYEMRARAAAQAGDFRTALRELVMGAMSWTERAGLIRYRPGLTNRDYVRAVWRMADRRESLLQIVGAFERVFYGRRPADAVTFEDCLGAYRRSFLTEANDAQPSS